MKYNVVIDGPNFISRLIEFGIDNEFITKEFSLNQFLNLSIKHTIRKEFGSVLSLGLEFFCSLKLPGPQSNKLTKDQWSDFKKRVSSENAVYVKEIESFRSNEEKGVDIAVATRLIEISEQCEIICLVSQDEDFIPVLEYLKRKGKYIIIVGLEDKCPTKLKNLSYLFININNHLQRISTLHIYIRERNFIEYNIETQKKSGLIKADELKLKPIIYEEEKNLIIEDDNTRDRPKINNILEKCNNNEIMYVYLLDWNIYSINQPDQRDINKVFTDNNVLVCHKNTTINDRINHLRMIIEK